MPFLRIGLIVVSVVIYIGGCFVLNGAVKAACTHGNCVHGWYSKYNDSEKMTFGLWAVGIPIVVAGLFLYHQSRRARGIGVLDPTKKFHGTETNAATQSGQAPRDRASASSIPSRLGAVPGPIERPVQAMAAVLFANAQAKARKKWICGDWKRRIQVGQSYWYYETDHGTETMRHRFCGDCKRSRSRQL